MIRIFALLAGFALLAACTAASPDEPLADLGEFRLGHNIVVASKAQKGPISRDATAEEWVTVMTGAVSDRFGRYQGSQLYHLGISVEGYMLAPKGVPVIYNPKSALIINVTVWDDAAAKKLNDEVEQFTIFETTTGNTLLMGSGRERTREEQMQGLARNAVGQIEDWLVKMHKEHGWFDRREGAATDAQGVATVNDVVPLTTNDAPAMQAPAVGG
ncbi:hypothetical protein [Pseudodonghicola xiamenensis]|uniref:Uncharacterized protein n=1 Tax=Pseudodonghicola xiamenensis TaxID=337702 RepID=A0A8J3MEW9_9RHOB|nr:hypothetical protein [Pseudodonghicola xiamenensis]GHH00554.1 hypothetical protein GCM10010961_37270 [Pseudodonghicola xiamenensis]